MTNGGLNLFFLFFDLIHGKDVEFVESISANKGTSFHPLILLPSHFLLATSCLLFNPPLAVAVMGSCIGYDKQDPAASDTAVDM